MMAEAEGLGSGPKLRIACVCASNMNRSMEAHNVLMKKGLDVKSYGTGNHVKLPGPSQDKPNIYPFGTPYTTIYDDLKKQNLDLYRQNGLLTLVDRNSKLKAAPERWQDQQNTFDVIITFEEKIFDIVVEGFTNQGPVTFQPVYIFDLNVKDNHEDAMLGAHQAHYLCSLILSTPNWEDDIDRIVEQFQTRYGRPILHTVQFY